MKYPITLTPDDGEFLVQCPDIPELITVGDDEDEALVNAKDALETAIEIYFDMKRPVPMPSAPEDGQPTAAVSALLASKVLLHNEMLAQGVRKAELARRLGVHMPQVDRLLNPRHHSRIDAVEAAFRSLGKQLDIRVV